LRQEDFLGESAVVLTWKVPGVPAETTV